MHNCVVQEIVGRGALNKEAVVRRRKQILVVSVVVLLIVASFVVNDRIVDFLSDPQRIREWIRNTGVRGVLFFVGINMLQVFLAVVPGGPITLTAGFVFGPVWGTMLCVLSCTVAATMVLLLVKKFGRSLVSVFVSDDKMRILDHYHENREEAKKIERLMILIFIIPGTPKDPINYMAGLTDIPIAVWFFVNLIGRIPGALLTALGGSAIGGGKFVVLLTAVGGLATLFIIGRVMRRMIG